MNKQRSSAGANRPQAVSTDFDDWETDPDYVRDIDEMDQRWGSRRTVGSINMNDLIDQVNREHKLMREKFQHPSQRLNSFANEQLTKTTRDPIHGYEERLSKHSSSQEISRKVYTSTSGSESGVIRDTSPQPMSSISDLRKTFVEKSHQAETSAAARPTIATKPDYINRQQTSPMKLSTFTASEPRRFDTNSEIKSTTIKKSDHSPYDEQQSTSTKSRIFKEENRSSSSSLKKGDADSIPHAFKSIQDNIDAFEKEFEDIKNKVSRKSDISRVIKKASNFETKSSKNDLSYVTRNNSNDYYAAPTKTSPPITSSTYKNVRSTSTSPSATIQSNNASEKTDNDQPQEQQKPRADIKGLSRKFETLFRESDDEFKRRTDARRKEFFDQIKSQVRETRKNLDGFDTVADDTVGSDADLLTIGKPKVYTRSETTKEEIVSKIVTENDKIIENETKRNVERSSSCHGESSDEEIGGSMVEPTSIKYRAQHMSKSPPVDEHLVRTISPIDEIKRKIPVVEPEIKGAGLMARTLYDYQAAEDDELTFDVDDLITNIDKVDREWYKGTITKAGRPVTGLFPANYVKLLNDSSEY